MRNNLIKTGAIICSFSAIVLLNISSCSKGTNPTPNQSNNNTGTTTDTTPTITSLSVTSGTFNTSVVINGTNFSTTLTDNKVYFNGVAATVTAATTTQLTVTVPQDAGTGVVTLSVKGSIAAVGPIFTYYADVKITSIDINSGAAGATVKITGSGFSTILSDNKVFFNGKAATVTAATATLLTVTVPDGAGNGAITISVAGGPAATGPNFTFFNTAALSITTIDVGKGMAGTVVNITGTGFSNNLAENNVFFNGKAAIVTAATTTQLTAIVPTGAGCGKITAVVKGITAVGPNFDYYLPSTVTTLASFPTEVPSLAWSYVVAGLATDNTGNVYVADNVTYTIKKVAPSGTVSTFAGLGNGSSYIRGNIGAITVDNLGNIYYASGNLFKITPTGNISIYSALGGSATGLACDNNNVLYVCDQSGSGLYRLLSGDTKYNIASLHTPKLLALATSGNMYVVESSTTISKIDPSNAITTFATENPMGMAVDANENLYFTSFNGDVIKCIDHNTGAISIIAKSSIAPNHIDGDQYTASFSTTGAITVDKAGNIYVADQNRIRKITLK